jgi:hypothetical protein
MKSFNQFIDEAGPCWAGYKPVPGKKKFEKGSCVKEAVNAAQQAAIAINMKKKGIKPKNEEVELDENEDKVNARKMYHKHFVAAMKVMPRSDKQRHHQAEMAKYKAMMGDSFVDQVAPKKFAKFDKKTNEEIELDETEAWQRKEGQNSEGGLNRKGIASYRAANPGSKLSMAVTTEPSKLKAGSKAANRRKSFCARMGGLKRRLTSSKTANDPDSRINKSLRKWNC